MKFRKLLSDSDDLSEQSIAMKGDWNDGLNSLSSMGIMGMKKWNKLLDITKELPKLSEYSKEFSLYQMRNSLIFKLGYWVIELKKTKLGIEKYPAFVSVFKISLTRYKHVENKLKYKKLVNVDSVAVNKDYQHKGISTFIYKYLVNTLNYTILGDKYQYFGARKLWARLSKELDVKVDLIDIKTKTKIKENVILYHGNYDKDFDKALWSYNNNKENIRSVLTGIKDIK